MLFALVHIPWSRGWGVLTRCRFCQCFVLRCEPVATLPDRCKGCPPAKRAPLIGCLRKLSFRHSNCQHSPRALLRLDELANLLENLRTRCSPIGNQESIACTCLLYHLHCFDAAESSLRVLRVIAWVQASVHERSCESWQGIGCQKFVARVWRCVALHERVLSSSVMALPQDGAHPNMGPVVDAAPKVENQRTALPCKLHCNA